MQYESKTRWLPQYGIWLILLLLFVAFISISSSQDSLFTDELRSVEHLGGPNGTNTLPEIVVSIAHRSSQHAPGFFFMLRGWTYLVGYSPLVLRFLSVLAGLVGIAFIYRLGTDLLDRRIGLTSAVLLGTASYYIFYMHELRMYSLFVMFGIIELWLYYRVAIRKTEPGRWDWVGLFATTLGLVAMHYHAIFLLIALGCYHLLFAPKNRRWIMTAYTIIASGIPFIVWIPVVIKGTETISSAKPWLEGITFFRVMFHQMGNGFGLYLIAGLAAGAIYTRRHPSRNLFYIWFTGVASLLVMFAVNEALPFDGIYRSGRYFVMYYPAFLLVVAAGLQMLPRRRWLLPLLLLIWTVTGLVYSQTEDFRFYNNRGIELGYVGYPPMTEISASLFHHKLNSPQSSLLILTNHEFVWRTQYEADYHLAILNMPGVVIDAAGLQEIQASTEFHKIGMVDQRASIFLAYSPQQIVRETVALAQSILENSYTLCNTLDSSDAVIVLHYVRKLFGCDLTAIPETTLVKFIDQDIIVHDARAIVQGDTAHIALAWRVDVNVPLHAYSVSLQIINPQGEKIDQRDHELEHGTGYWYLSSLDIADWESGIYTVELAVYDWRTQERLNGTLPDGQPLTALPVVQFEIP